jgi:hypothetical protein
LKDNQKFTELKSLRLEFLLERQHVCVTEAWKNSWYKEKLIWFGNGEKNRDY